jgi:hypothetical protein
MRINTIYSKKLDMKSIFSKKNILSVITLALALVFVALAARATYVQPATGATGNNAYGYIDIGGTPGGAGAGVKLGGLAVNAFSAKDNALFNDQVFFNAPIHGSASAPTSINFGDTTHVVGLSINNNMQGQTLQSDTTKNKHNSAGAGLDYLCSDATGTLLLCDEVEPPSFDLCSNIPGVQTTVPDGYVRNPDGTCSQDIPANAKISWSYTNIVGTGGNFRISVNGTTKVSQSTTGSGTLTANVGDSISIIVQTKVTGTAVVQVSGTHTYFGSEAHITSHSFTAQAGNLNIGGISDQ